MRCKSRSSGVVPRDQQRLDPQRSILKSRGFALESGNISFSSLRSIVSLFFRLIFTVLRNFSNFFQNFKKSRNPARDPATLKCGILRDAGFLRDLSRKSCPAKVLKKNPACGIPQTRFCRSLVYKQNFGI